MVCHWKRDDEFSRILNNLKQNNKKMYATLKHFYSKKNCALTLWNLILCFFSTDGGIIMVLCRIYKSQSTFLDTFLDKFSSFLFSSGGTKYLQRKIVKIGKICRIANLMEKNVKPTRLLLLHGVNN